MTTKRTLKEATHKLYKYMRTRHVLEKISVYWWTASDCFKRNWNHNCFNETTMKGTFPLGAMSTNERDETLTTRLQSSPDPTSQGIQWMVVTMQTPGKVTWGRDRRNYQIEHRDRAQDLFCGETFIWKNLFGLLETLVGWTYSSAPEASERKWLRCFEVSGIRINGAYKVGTLHPRTLCSVFGDD